MSKTPTPLQVVYDRFLSSVTADDWMLEEDEELIRQDWLILLRQAIDRFERPMVSLSIQEPECEGEEPTNFEEELTSQEIGLLARYMKLEWLNRVVADWRQIKQLYSNKDFSQANHLDKLIKLQRNVEYDCFKAQRRYRRSYQGETFDFSKMAGRQS